MSPVDFAESRRLQRLTNPDVKEDIVRALVRQIGEEHVSNYATRR
jgi:hypothetical protein